MDSTMTSVPDPEQNVTQKDAKKRLVKALFSYTPANTDELPLKINDILEVIEETEEGWWKGIRDGNIGMFPSNFVIELDEIPEEFNNHLTNELSPLKNCTKKNVIQQDKVQDSISDSSNQSLSNKSELKPVSVSSVSEEKAEGSPAPKRPPDPEKKVVSRSKKLTDSSAPRLPPKPVREQARVMFPYQALNEDELSLKEGDIITVLSKEIEDKGWWKGELNNRIGVFPDNFVQLLKVEEQKKPERPDKPPAVMSSKAIIKASPNDKGVSDSSPKLDKKIVKTPPLKPPPPEMPKKVEPERPPPPYPGKKPQLPHPMKKPSRSSLGTKLPVFPPPTAVNSVKSPVPEINPSVASSVSSNEIKADIVTKVLERNVAKEERTNKKDDLLFDVVEPTEKKLVHLTANRAKVPNKRPPSHIFLKESEKENSIAGDNRRLSEPLPGDINALQFLDNEIQKGTSGGKKMPPSRPSPPSMRKTDSLPKQGTVKSASKFFASNDDIPKLSKNRINVIESTKVSDKDIHHHKVSEISSAVHQVLDVASIVQQQHQKIPDTLMTTSHKLSDVPATVSVASTVCEQTISDVNKLLMLNSSIAPESSELAENNTDPNVSRGNTKMEITSTVSRSEYIELLNQVQELKEELQKHNCECNEAIKDLRNKFQEERKLRITIENELQHIKEFQNVL